MKRIRLSALSFFLALSALLLILYFQHFAPFGTNSMGCFDANIDYIDIFAYLKDVLEGKNNGIYTFSKGLGGNMIAVLTTGYASPLNLLVLLFEKQDLHSFFDIIVVLKIALAAFTMSIFLQRRFYKSIEPAYVLALSFSYAFGQYNFAQASNIFWLEGVYMLPLFMLGTYQILQGKHPYLLLFSVAYNVLFSWYSAAWNCFFTIVWFIVEALLLKTDKEINSKKLLIALGKCVFAATVGIMISAIFFFPTIVGLGKGNEGTLNFELFLNSFRFTGNILTALTNYSIGSVSSSSMVSLFCGSFILVLTCAFFFSSRYQKKSKIIIGGLLAFSILCYYWYPLFLVFSEFKAAQSFWFRYSYLGIFTLVFIAGLYCRNIDEEQKAQKAFPLIAVGYLIVLLMYYKDTDPGAMKWIYISIFSVFVFCGLLGWKHLENHSFVKIGSSRVTIGIKELIMCLVVVEMICNSVVLLKSYRYSNIDVGYVSYQKEGQIQIDTIKESDMDLYRITQTRTRGTTPGRLTATYDEPEQFNYWSLTAYTSSPDDIQREFLARSGYPLNGEDMYIVNTSILPIDSLLGVRYVLSDYEIPGLEKTKLTSGNGKATYYNSYALPMAFKTRLAACEDTEESKNPFQYQNMLYQQLTGRSDEVFYPVKYEVTESGKNRIVYRLDLPQDTPVYGNLPWAYEANESIYVGDYLITEYAKWTSPSVFFIPATSASSEIIVKAPEQVSVSEVQFYAVDLNILSSLTGQLRSGKPEQNQIENGHAKFRVAGEDGEYLCTTITYDSDWHITRNGEEIEPELIGDCLMAIPLLDGDNMIEMIYQASGIVPGLITTVAGLLITMCYLVFHKVKDRNLRRV